MRVVKQAQIESLAAMEHQQINKTTQAKSWKSVPSAARAISFTQNPFNQIFLLQQTVGNHGVKRLFCSGVIQTKLNIGEPGGQYEQEADRVAEQVIRMSEPIAKGREEDEEQIVKPNFSPAQFLLSYSDRLTKREKSHCRRMPFLLPHTFKENAQPARVAVGFAPNARTKKRCNASRWPRRSRR